MQLVLEAVKWSVFLSYLDALALYSIIILELCVSNPQVYLQSSISYVNF